MKYVQYDELKGGQWYSFRVKRKIHPFIFKVGECVYKQSYKSYNVEYDLSEWAGNLNSMPLNNNHTYILINFKGWPKPLLQIGRRSSYKKKFIELSESDVALFKAQSV